tara:strand:- start:940 stop:1152 length:213 start_codon:yes stop_codon:yes gene_type:complete
MIAPRGSHAKSQSVANKAKAILQSREEPQDVKDVALWVLGLSNIDGEFVKKSARVRDRVPDPKPPPIRKK